MAEITGAELLINALHAEGMDNLHAITDGSYMTVMEVLHRRGQELKIRLLVPRHEAAAVHMADAYARVTGKPGVVMACAGPGAANMLSGVICAQAENIPLIAISTCRRAEISDLYRHMGASQSPDHVALFKPATKWNGRVEHWHRIPDMVRHAYRVATSGNPGPVHLVIPENVLAEKHNDSMLPMWSKEKARITDARGTDPTAIERAALALVNAQLVNIHAGAGATRAAAGEEILALAEHLQAAVTNSVNARGIIDERHELFFAPLCMASFMAHQTADLILAIGTRLGEFHMWGKPPLWGDPKAQTTIQIDIDPTNIGINRPVDHALTGDAKAVLRQLIDAVKRLQPQANTRSEHLATMRQIQTQWRDELNGPCADLERTPMLTGQILNACNEFYGDNAIVALDGGNTTLWSMQYHIARRQRSLLYTTNMGFLGSGLPYAMGAKLAAPERPVYCVTGDSAFGFNIQELESAARLGLNVVILVAVDQAYGMEKTAQKRVYGREDEWFHHDLSPVRYDKVAQAMGCHGEYVNRAADLPAALERANGCGKPAVIHCDVDPVANIDPPGMWIWTSARTGKMQLPGS